MQFPSLFKAFFILYALSFAALAQETERAKPARILMSYGQMGASYDWFKAREPYFHHLYYQRTDGHEQSCALNLHHLSDYSTLVLCPGLNDVSAPFTPLARVSTRDMETLGEFVNAGGNLVLVGTAVYYFNSPEGLKLIGLTALLDGSQAYRSPCASDLKKHPVFSLFVRPDVDEVDDTEMEEAEEAQGAKEMDRSLMATPVASRVADAIAVLKSLDDPPRIAASERALGKGKILVLPQELFPPFRSQTRQVAPEDVDSRLENFFPRLFDHLRMPRIGDAVRAAMRDSPIADRRLAVWFREPDHTIFQGAAMLLRPAPADASELLTEVHRVVGINEYERIPLYLTVQGIEGTVTIRLVQDTPAKPDLFSRAKLRFQGPPANDLPGPTVYLSDLERDGRGWVVNPGPSGTMTLWLQVQTAGVSAGAYSGKLLFTCYRGQQSVQITLDVRPVALPDYPLHHFEAETNALAQFVSNKPENIATAAQDLAEAHSDHIMTLPTLYQDVTVRETGRPLAEFLVAENRERFEKGNLPGLDLTEAADWYLHEAIQHGLIVHRSYYHLNAERYLGFLRAMFDNRELSEKSPEYLVFLRWYLVETLAYLREKGFRFCYLKFGDEWMPEELPSFLEGVRPAREAGWKIAANPNGPSVLGALHYRAQLRPVIDLYWESAGPQHYVACAGEIGQEREVVAPDGLWMVTTSSWWWNKTLTAGFEHGYTMAYNDVRSLHYHGWSRGGNHGVFLDMRQGRFIVRPSIGYLHLGEGVEEAEFLTMAKRLIRYGQQHGRHMKSFEARLASIVGPEATILPMISGEGDKAACLLGYLPHPEPGTGLATYRRAKAALLGLIEDLREDLCPVERKLRWGTFWLYDGRLVPLTLACGPGLDAAMQVLEGGLLAKSEGTVKIEKLTAIRGLPDREGVSVLILDAADESLRTALLGVHPELSLAADYPPKDSYALYGPLEAKNGHRIVVAGNGPAGVALGCRNLLRFIEDVY